MALTFILIDISMSFFWLVFTLFMLHSFQFLSHLMLPFHTYYCLFVLFLSFCKLILLEFIYFSLFSFFIESLLKENAGPCFGSFFADTSEGYPYLHLELKHSCVPCIGQCKWLVSLPDVQICMLSPTAGAMQKPLVETELILRTRSTWDPEWFQ